MLDLILVVLVVFCVINGKNKGFVRVVLELGSFIIAYMIAARLGPYVGTILDSMFNISDKVKDSINIPFVDTTNEIIRFVNIVGYLVVFTVSRFVLSIIIVQTSILNHIPLLGSANKVAGAMTGFIKGYLFSLVIVWLLSFVAVDWAQNLVDSSFLAPALLNSFPSLYEKLNIMLSR